MSATSSIRQIREQLFNLLHATLDGEVRKERPYRIAYSTDASIFEVEPLLVVLPKHKWDVIKTLKIAHAHSISVTPRGAATGTTGGALGTGIILDLSKYMRSFHFKGQSVTCDAGVIQDELNQALSFYDLRLGPETSSGNRATLGGMYACNAAGANSPKFGTMADHVLSCEMVLSDGSLVQFGPLTEEQVVEKCALKSLEGTIYRQAIALQSHKLQLPQLPRRVSGYAIDRLQEKPFNLAKVLAGSEGTLGIVTEVEMQVVKILPSTHLELHFFKTAREAFGAIPELLKEPFISMEMIDSHIIEAAKRSFIAKHHLSWIHAETRCVIYLEKEGFGDEELKKSVQLVRKKGLELLLSRRGYTRAVGFLEDISYPREKSLEFYDQFLSLFNQIPDLGIYGHVGAGCLHLRPFIDLRTDRKQMLDIMQRATLVLKNLGGSLSGEHGDGMVRSWLNKELYGDTVYEAFKALKRAFDPKGILNPGKILSTHFPEEHLRATPPKEVETFLDFSAEGGLALSADLCNGNGQCRKKDT
jgi:FAD/FMN-containing dehydrogenase